jgi:hypothetical protein
VADAVRTISLDYPVRPEPRYGWGKPPHQRLTALLDARRPAITALLEGFRALATSVCEIGVNAPKGPGEPFWNNGWFEGLDALALYGLLVRQPPRHYVEIGSGNSTKFARRAIRDHGLPTQIVSIDPTPRAEIDALCDQVARHAVEDVDMTFLDELQTGDIVFIDNSHRCFMNSDATVCFLDLLPRLPPGVLVHFHDIYLPFDYPPQWAPRFYSEQYLLAVHLLARDPGTTVLLPNSYVRRDPELSAVLAPLWSRPELAGVKDSGASFWLVKDGS